MPNSKPKYHLFEAYGVELEYMIVDIDTLKIQPIADKLIEKVTGKFTSDVERGEIAWSNELVSHVIELKTNGPASSLEHLPQLFHENVNEINMLLTSFNSMLLPTAVHPFMAPLTETVIWPHEYNEIYNLYNRIFNCKGHGWSNLQSTHINLPFFGDDEFGRLHAAIRLVMPIVPALTASSPIIDGNLTGFMDTRLENYRHNQESIPSIAGSVIPEAVFTRRDYFEKIFNRINHDIRSYDIDGILNHNFLNSRGAIARFDRNAIEIRIIDIQECPAADIAILDLIINVIKALVYEKWQTSEQQKYWDEKRLASIFLEIIRNGSKTNIHDKEYLQVFGIEKERASAADVWSTLYAEVKENLLPSSQSICDFIIEKGNLAERIVERLNNNPETTLLYKELSECLAKNKPFKP